MITVANSNDGSVPKYRIVQNFRGTKLSRLGHHVSIHRKIFVFASKQRTQVPKHYEICRKTFAVQAKTVKITKVLALEPFVLYGTAFGFHSPCTSLALTFLYHIFYITKSKAIVTSTFKENHI